VSIAVPVDQGDSEAARRLALDRLRIEGREVHAQIGDALIDAPWERSIDGASTLTLNLIDPAGDLLDSGLFHTEHAKGRRRVKPVEVEIEVEDPDRPLGFTLVSVQTSPNHLGLVFEDREVYLLRQHTRPRKASRAKVTRAEFVQMLVREVKVERIRFWCPELHKRQPIRKRRDLEPKATKNERRRNGFGEGASVQVKGKDASRAQIRVLEAVLDTGQSHGATRRVLIGSVMCVTQESTASNLRGGDRDSVGAFQQRRSMGWPASRDVARDATEFFKRAIPVFRSNPGRSIGWCVDAVQRSHTFGTGAQGKDYDQWREEAEATVDTYLGSSAAAGGGRPGVQYVKRYEFRRGEPGQPRENSWDAAGRLADEVRWRRFMDRGVFHFVSDNYLRRAAPRLRLVRTALPQSIIEVRVGDLDVGKEVAEVEVDAFADTWLPPVGSTAQFTGYGPADGRYLLAGLTGNLFSPKVTARYVAPIRKLAEPASELAQRAGAQSDVRGSLSGTKVAAAYARAKEIHAKRYPYVYGGGHAHIGKPDGGITGRGIGFDCTGAVAAVLDAGDMVPHSWRRGGVPSSSTMAISYGEPGKGHRLTVYVNGSHGFIVFHDVAGKGDEHFGTGNWGKGWDGAGFNPHMHPTAGFTARHWAGDNRGGSRGDTAPSGRLPGGFSTPLTERPESTRPLGEIGGGDF
jgi:hypothetical protein